MAIIGPGITIGPGIIFQTSTGLYEFTNFTFTNGNIIGPTSGNLTRFLANYSNVGNTWINSTSYYNIATPGYQLWTVPQTATYEIEVAGSRSGISGYTGNVQANIAHGKGAIVRGRFTLSRGQQLTIAVGQPSANSSTQSSFSNPGGGGGTFVVSSNVPLIVAGGGGGTGTWSGNTTTILFGGNGTTSTWAGNSRNGGKGGVDGQGGNSHVNTANVVSSNSYDSGGGGGFYSNGVNGAGGNVRTNSTNGSTGGGGQGFFANLIGGVQTTTYSSQTSPGGFGGGGGAGPITGGGGGGYSGGGGTWASTSTAIDAGGGGGSYIDANATVVATSDGNYNGNALFGGSSITNLGSFNNAPGYVKITKL